MNHNVNVAEKIEFTDNEHRKWEPIRFLNYFNTVKTHSALTRKNKENLEYLLLMSGLRNIFYG